MADVVKGRSHHGEYPMDYDLSGNRKVDVWLRVLSRFGFPIFICLTVIGLAAGACKTLYHDVILPIAKGHVELTATITKNSDETTAAIRSIDEGVREFRSGQAEMRAAVMENTRAVHENTRMVEELIKKVTPQK